MRNCLLLNKFFLDGIPKCIYNHLALFSSSQVCKISDLTFVLVYCYISVCWWCSRWLMLYPETLHQARWKKILLQILIFWEDIGYPFDLVKRNEKTTIYNFLFSSTVKCGKILTSPTVHRMGYPVQRPRHSRVYKEDKIVANITPPLPLPPTSS